MLRELKLTNFRRHRAATFTFGPGHNVIRGVNEAGKTTLAEAFAYALFGSRALRDKLADVVTWGEKEASLKVEVTIQIGTMPYVFSRGKSGAECAYGEKLVTGQDEVSKFAAALLGADWTIAPKLMLASQNGLRGALEQGPTATADMIESLADFNLFERLIAAMTQGLALGPAGPYEERLAEAEGRLEACPALEEVDEERAKLDIIALRHKAQMTTSNVKNSLQPAVVAAKKELDLEEANQKARERAHNALQRAREAEATHYDQRGAAVAQAALAPTDAEIAAARAAVEDAKNLEARISAYRAVTKLMEGYPEEFWDEPVESLDNECTKLAGIRQIALETLAGNSEVIAVAKAKRVVGSVCGFCDQDTSQFPEVAARNAEIDVIVASGEASTARVTAHLAEVNAQIATFNRILKAADAFQRAADRYASFADVDESVVPPRLTWKGEVPDGDTDQRNQQKRLLALEEQKGRAERAKGAIESLDRALADDALAIERLTHEVSNLPDARDQEALSEAYVKAKTACEAAEIWARDFEVKASRLELEMTQQIATVAARRAQRETLAAQIDECKRQLTELGFNNALLQKIRKARPQIADKLWNTVLASVTTMFSQMRGETSLVAKDKTGFTVNGKPVSSLSGSTLDLLGLAIRVALIKTFLPYCNFILLDEPFAACDSDRTDKMLGFITTAGFQQTLTITHEESSEAVSDNLVTL